MLLSFLSVNSQNFPGKDVQLLMNKQLKVKELEEYLQPYGYKNFYNNNKLKRKYKSKNKYDDTKYSDLVGKVFKVIAIEEYKNYSDQTKSMLKIENEETGILYYKYNEQYENAFEFDVIGGIDFPEGYFCKDLKVSEDKFSDKITTRSPYKEAISFTKVESDKGVQIYMSVDVYGSTINVNKKGATFLLANKKKLVWENAKITSKINRRGKGYIYSSFILLSKEDIKTLSENKVTDVRLYIYDKEIKNNNKIKEYIKCISK